MLKISLKYLHEDKFISDTLFAEVCDKAVGRKHCSLRDSPLASPLWLKGDSLFTAWNIKLSTPSDFVMLTFCLVNLAEQHRGGNVPRVLSLLFFLFFPSSPTTDLVHFCNLHWRGKKNLLGFQIFLVFLLVMLKKKQTQLTFEQLYSFGKVNGFKNKSTFVSWINVYLVLI